MEKVSFHPLRMELYRGIFYDFTITTQWPIKTVETTLPDYLVKKESDTSIRIEGIVSVPPTTPLSPHLIIVRSATGTIEDFTITVDVLEDLREKNPFWSAEIEMDS